MAKAGPKDQGAAGQSGKTHGQNQKISKQTGLSKMNLIDPGVSRDQLLENEHRYHELFNHISSGVAVYEAVDNGNDFVIKDFNAAAERIEQTPRKKVIGRKVTDVFPGIREMKLLVTFQRVWKTGKPEHHPVSIYKDEHLMGWRENYVYKLPSGEIVAVYEDLTERKRMEEELRLSEERHRAISSLMPDHILVHDRQLKYTFVVNPQLGLTEKEMLGKTDYDFLPKDEADKLTRAKKSVMRSGKPMHFETSLLSKSGETEYFDGSFVPRIDARGKVIGLIGYFRNVTERKQVMGALQIEQELMNSLMDHTADSIYFKDLQGRFIRVSRNLAVKHGELDAAHVIGKTDFDFFDKVSAQRFYEIEQKIIRSGKPQIDMEEEECWADGRVTWASTTAFPYRDKKGKIIGIIGITRDITAHKLAEIKLRENEERFRSLYENATIGIYQTTPDGKILMANPSLLKMLGYQSLDELTRRNLNDEGFEPDYPRKEFQRRIEKQGEVHGLESSWKRKDGSTVYVRESAKVVRGSSGKALYYEGTVEDISERHAVESALRESESRYRGLFEYSPISLWEEDFSGVRQRLDTLQAMGVRDMPAYLESHPEEVDGCMALVKVLDVNKATLALFNYKDKKKLINNFTDILSQGRKDFIAELEYLAQGRTAFNWEGTNLTQNNKTIHVSIYWAAAPGHEKDLSKVLVSIVDITDRIRAETQLRGYSQNLEKRVEDRTREFQGAQEKLLRQERLATMGQLAGSVGHELRNPLNVISSSIYLLKKTLTQIDERSQDYLDIIDQETKKSAKIIKDLLDFGRRSSANRAKVNVSSIITQSLIRNTIPENIQVSFPGISGTIVIEADPQQIGQVLDNLVTNACQAMPEGGKLSIKAVKEKGQVKISVADTGTGISPENLNRLFEPLFTTKARGIGLGLALSKNYVEANGGVISVKSELNKGSAFTLSFKAEV